jgi:large subunit ribosomal protein L23
MSKSDARLSDYDIIRIPVLTEKTSKILEEGGAYVFNVSKSANKPQIKGAVERVFRVKVKKVNVMNVSGKTKIFRGRPGKRPDSKKAIVKLEPGYRIDFGVEI